jgi:hypothetical protein
MLIRLGYDIQFDLPAEVAMIVMLNVHPSHTADLLEPVELKSEPGIRIDSYIDGFGNRCSRFVAPQGSMRLNCSTLIQNSDEPDPVNLSAREHPVGDLPPDMLTYLLSSRVVPCAGGL